MHLRILQYNTHRNPTVLRTLTANPANYDLDLILISEPPPNPNKFATSLAPGAPFLPIYPTDRHSRACILIHKLLPIRDLAVQFLDDITIARFTLHDRPYCAISIYNPPSKNFNTDAPCPVHKLQQCFPDGDNIILGGDFNLHHDTWSQRQTQNRHATADTLLALTSAADLELITPPATTTFNGPQDTSTVDLIFLSASLVSSALSHVVSRHADSGSDHLPLLTTLLLDHVEPQAPPTPHPKWKEMDEEQVATDSSYLYVPTSFTSRDTIDSYAEYLQQFILTLATSHVPQSRPPNPYRRQTTKSSTAWWTPEIPSLVQAERHARRHRLDPKTIATATRHKNQAIQKASRKAWRSAVHDAKDSERGIWGLARWACERSDQPVELPFTPPLTQSDGTLATSFLDKATTLHAAFFPPPPTADLSDIADMVYPTPLVAPPITAADIHKALYRTASWKAPGPDGIPTGFLKAMGRPLENALTALAQACWNWHYVPAAFRVAKTVVLRKARKPDYSSPKAWRPIALLNTLGKVIEAVTARHLADLAESHHMLPPQQMGARLGRSTETAVQLLLAQVRTVWKNKGIASVLPIDVSGSYDHVVHDRLIDILRRKRVPDAIVGWVCSFISNRSTTLAFDKQTSPAMPVTAGIPQGSPISPILFLFYNSELLNVCNCNACRSLSPDPHVTMTPYVALYRLLSHPHILSCT